jgi:hypothetical protein
MHELPDDGQNYHNIQELHYKKTWFFIHERMCYQTALFLLISYKMCQLSNYWVKFESLASPHIHLCSVVNEMHKSWFQSFNGKKPM